MDYEKAYKAVLKTAIQWIKDGCTDKEKICLECVFPELRESEDERIRNCIRCLTSLDQAQDVIEDMGFTRQNLLDWLEKQKYDRMKPIYNAKESFESALEKAWNDYHNGYESVDKLEDDYVECAHAKGFREGYLFGIKKQKEPENASTSTMIPSCWEVGQKEQKPNYCHHKVDETGWTEEYRKAYYDGWNNCNMQHEQLKADQKPAEWSEKDEAAYDAFICEVVNEKMNPTIEQVKWLRSIRDRLKSLRPSWKPSEEQMKALQSAKFIYKDGLGNKEMADTLESLYEQLKKL